MILGLGLGIDSARGGGAAIPLLIAPVLTRTSADGAVPVLIDDYLNPAYDGYWLRRQVAGNSSFTSPTTYEVQLTASMIAAQQVDFPGWAEPSGLYYLRDLVFYETDDGLGNITETASPWSNVLTDTASGSTTWDAAHKNSAITLSNGDLTLTGGVDGGTQKVRAVASASGKKYFEIRYDTRVADLFIGLITSTYAGYGGVTDPYLTADGVAMAMEPGYADIRGPSGALTDVTATLGGGGSGAIAQCAFDTAAGKAWFGINNTWRGDPGAGTGGFTTPSGTLHALAYVTQNDVLTGRFPSASQT